MPNVSVGTTRLEKLSAVIAGLRPGDPSNRKQGRFLISMDAGVGARA
ncbi:hypothetical protein A33M_1793 [Rhodovulum sp. PH10]|nr:hypothetical protein A33M_1793 [Rhodovulum sp. PH10]